MIFNHFFFRENRRSFLLFRCWQNSGVSGSLVTISSYFSPGMFPEADFRYTTSLVGLTKLEPLGSCQFDFQNFFRKKRIEVGKGVWKSGDVKTCSYLFLGRHLTEHIPFWLSFGA